MSDAEDLKMGRWDRRIVSMQAISKDESEFADLYAVDNEGKAWVMLSLWDGEWMPIAPLPRESTWPADESAQVKPKIEKWPEIDGQAMAEMMKADSRLARALLLEKARIRQEKTTPRLMAAWARARDVEEDIKIGSKVMVYDRYRFAFPLPGVVERFGEKVGDKQGVEVILLGSNTVSHPVGSTVWVHKEQLRLMV